MDQVRISVTRVLVDPNTLRFKFDIIAYTERGAEHFGFLRYFAQVQSRVEDVKSRAEIASILRSEHTAAWQRYHKYVE